MGANYPAKNNPRPALWLVRLDGGPSKMLHDLDKAAQDAAEPLEWRASGVVSILAAERNGWPLVEMTVSPKTWAVEKQPVVVSVLPRQSSRPAQSRDRLIYATTSLRTGIWTQRVKNNGTPAGPARLTLICPGTFCMPWLTSEGRRMAYSSYHNRWTFHAKTLDEEGEKKLESGPDPPPWIAVDGAARHVFIPQAVGPSRGSFFASPSAEAPPKRYARSVCFPGTLRPTDAFCLP